mgnify:FL=1
MIASLPMYDRPELRMETDALWAEIRDALRRRGEPAPERLTRDTPVLWSHWQDPDLVFSQTCGMPYRTRLHGHVTLLGTPDFGLPACPPGYYRSILVMRRLFATNMPSEWGKLRLAVNDFSSQSGWAAPQNYMAGHGFSFNKTVETGAHQASVAAVIAGEADIASIDAQTWRLMCRFDDPLSALVKVGETPPTPGLPYITRIGAPANLYRAAVDEAIARLAPRTRRSLGLLGFTQIPASAYCAVPTPDLLEN